MKIVSTFTLEQIQFLNQAVAGFVPLGDGKKAEYDKVRKLLWFVQDQTVMEEKKP